MSTHRSLLTITLIALLCVGSPVVCEMVLARNIDGRYDNIDPKIREWVRGLHNSKGENCCDTADGYPADVEWDISDQSYWVRINGAWHKVPPEAVLTGPNRLGYAVVWYWTEQDAAGTIKINIRCFLPGGGT